MNRPPERLADRQGSGSPAEQRAGDLLRALKTAPRLGAAADVRLERKVAEMVAGSRPRRRLWTMIAIPAALAIAIFAVVKPSNPIDQGVHSRGPEHRSKARRAAMPPTELLTFRIGPGGRSEPLGEVIGRDDELAFAYRTDGSDQRLLVFARDEEGRIYWYHPAWTDPTENPAAIPLSRDPGVHELPAAIAQPFRGGVLEICGLFTTTELRVREVEQGLTVGQLPPDCRKVTVGP